MTPRPSTGDIWQWTGQYGAGHILLEELEDKHGEEEYWRAIVLETGEEEQYVFHPKDVKYWRFIA